MIIGLYYIYVYMNVPIDLLIYTYIFKNIYILKIILDNINFVKVKIIRVKHQQLNSKINVPHFWNNYIANTIILDPKVLKRRSS
jgi:hypothetical protein